MLSTNGKIVKFISQSKAKVNFKDLKMQFCRSGLLSQKSLKSIIKTLIEDGTLKYIYEFGRSYIDISYERPILISEHVYIKPENSSFHSHPGQTVIALKKGSSFGGGEHPTTRLCIHLIDVVLHSNRFSKQKDDYRGLDIGTGSGILALVAAKLGVKSITALDNNPCAIYEAKDNVCLNGMSEKIIVENQTVSELSGCYDLVMANLRYPTLIDLREVIDKKLKAESTLILSGLKPDEVQLILHHYKKSRFIAWNKVVENGWCAICLVRD
ncbi:50S ribosomal protein L11 methyltransferase [Desulfosarcina ovata]|uniref:Ribosomal protein L11 methyltransferase n=1 Tax=Desulfosarcina ovata subsp. ovata TaxID=2752305 RepID=A0A5K8AD49_9BACT|nr:50S ribosomal protein L11 methyltransferase [Desulfosarcina ovata]BBO90487.1 hypothetical protein DSCOOX_36670 [Desulfosarcina ovata subsp. ovata]